MIARSERLELYRRMTFVRRYAERAAQLPARPEISDLDCVGGEAVLAGVAHPLRATDHFVSTAGARVHRIAKGANASALTVERISGLSEAADAHDSELRFVHGGFEEAIEIARTVAGTEIVCCFFGDELLSQGAFHEAMNQAANERLPLVFACDNNFYGMGTLFDGAICQEDLYRFASGYKMPSVRVDGADVLEVLGAAREVYEYARAGEGPSLVDAVTYRPRGPVRPGFPSPHEEMILRDRDPLINFRADILKFDPAAESLLDEIDREVVEQIERAFKAAQHGGG